jgi:HAD superfamily hydrolase (TIGR01450 family)
MTVDLLYSEPYPSLDGEQVFAHYEYVRKRLPQAAFPNQSQNGEGLLEIAEHFDVFVFDAYGVLNVGSTPIATSPAVVARLRELGKRVMVLSNGASYTAEASVRKFDSFGFDFCEAEIVSSRIAAERALNNSSEEFLWGAIAKPDFSSDELVQPTLKLADNRSDYEKCDGFLLLSTLDWNEERQLMLEQSLANNLRPVLVANPDVVSPREDHFGLEPGYIGHRLIDKFGANVVFHGKPFASVFDIVDERLEGKYDPQRICMIGDTLHTDILGGAAHGWKTVLVCDHGMFKALDAQEYISRSGIVPDWVIPTI